MNNLSHVNDISEILAFIQELVCEVFEESMQNRNSSCEEFSRDKRLINRKNEENGFYHVDNLMRQWNQLPELENWSYSIEHIDGIINETLKYHAFQIKWAKPMAGYTHPIIAVNVYVFVKMILVECNYSVEMSYNFEGNRFVHDARYPFNSKWLLNAYDDKKSVINTLSL